MFSKPKHSAESVVISGVAGRFPKSRNISEFRHNLYNHVDMVGDKQGRWSPMESGQLAKRMGLLEEADKFDAMYFGIPSNHVKAMDPQLRFLLELSVEAIFDAGINPATLRNSRTDVYLAVSFMDSTFFNIYDKITEEMPSIYGSVQATLANRISFSLNLTGTSMVVDTACSGSLVALQQAYHSLKSGRCDAAIVAGSTFISHPNVSICFGKLGMTSPDGFCRPFSDAADGFARSETTSVLFLQRESDSKRVYAHVVHVDSNTDGFKPEGFSCPSKYRQKELYERFYKEIDLQPSRVDYVEMHGTGTTIGDPLECWAVDQVFNQGREEPLLIGSVKSNMGHGECASPNASIAKAILVFESGLIPPTLHFEKPNPDIPSLCEKRLKVCTEVSALSGSQIAVNAFGFSGVNAHTLLKQYAKLKVDGGRPEDDLPRLVVWTGRTEEALNSLFDQVVEKPLDAEFVGLTHEIQRTEVQRHTIRGFGIFKKGKASMQPAICVERDMRKCDDKKHPVVWMFTGMGSHWPGMAEVLMKMDTFRHTIERCQKALDPHGYDLISVLESTDPSIVNNIANAMTAITAIQMGLVDVLKTLNVPIDYIIGHSLGETAAAYADGASTVEQSILCSYFRGKYSKQSKLIDGRMYAVGVGYKTIKDLLPEGVFCACRNSSTSSTISGPKEAVERLVVELKSRGIFVKEVNVANIAYHSKYVQPIADAMRPELKRIIETPLRRSEKWLSTCYAQSEWGKPATQYVNVEYHLQNLLGGVLFEDVLQMLPEDAIVIEIGPSGLLQAVVKRELPDDIHVPLLKKFGDDNLVHFMKALGK